ncbi:MAG: hypothetical protein AAF499_06905 [Pseudomonadota bacterium]
MSNAVTPFKLNRLETDQGTFRLAGRHSAVNVEVTELSLLSTDGYVELDMQHPNVKPLIDALEADILLALESDAH